MGARTSIPQARVDRLKAKGFVLYGPSQYVFHRFDTNTMENVIFCALCRKTVRLKAYTIYEQPDYQRKIEFYLAHCHDTEDLGRTYEDYINDIPF